MQNIDRTSLILRLVIFLTLLPLTARAIPAITCHCFTERTYDAAQPAAADPYFLATTQNSFLALVFNIDKKDIVITKQQGTSSDDLWIACWAGSRAGVSPDSLLHAREKHHSWKDAMAAQRVSLKSLGPRFSNALNAKSSSAALAEIVVDELFLRYRILPETDIAAIRKAGATNQEMIVAAVIATRSKQPVKKILLEVKSGSKTWGTLLLWANIDPQNMQQEVSDILKLSRR